MENVIQQMLSSYEIKNIEDKKNAMKEIMQELVLCGLSRAGFFKKAAFYGGTALRIFYGLDRFSEDLDFSLMVTDSDFKLDEYFPILSKEIKSYGLNVEIKSKDKSIDSHIKSAFLKGDTKEHLLLFYPNEKITGVSHGELIKIKFEIDVDPPKLATYEHKYRLLPAPYEVNLYDASSLFAGKIHAVICRGWKNRVKGRDLYDLIFYISRNIPVNLSHLKERLLQTNTISEGQSFTLDDVKELLYQKFDCIDFEEAKKDVIPFIKNVDSLTLWNSDFFKQISSQIRAK
ncbi:MAG: nucleotidyl transferase AbiEii/AbiGii toxin family protein [Erysipelotrichaceae bacterium]|nr:nucleotidyl transferase AbiEii/AbiGii toxin family protein [Erysipelotrichaceae bacterium]